MNPKSKPIPKPESEAIFIHASANNTAISRTDHGKSLIVPNAVIATLSFSTVGFLLKMLSMEEDVVADILKKYAELSPETLDQWCDELRNHGYLFRRQRPDGAWEYVISERPLTIEEAADRFAGGDAK